jgi:hypothetical protein
MLKRLKREIKHKLNLFRWKNLKSYWEEYGLPFVIILIVWEIIEDILFPIAFWLLGKFVDPAFYAAIPVAWLLCVHPIAVPIIWSWYCFVFKKKKKEVKLQCEEKNQD